MNRAQAQATLALLGWQPVFYAGIPGFWQPEGSLLLAMGTLSLASGRCVWCTRVTSRGAIAELPEPRSLTDQEVVWILQAAQQELKPGDNMHCQQVVRGRK